MDDAQQVSLEWQDEFGLSGKEPFKVAITAVDDEPPQVICDDLPRGKVVLDTEQLVFHVHAHDDFGVKQVGMVWRGIPSDMVEKPAAGRSVLAAGGHEQAALEVQGHFHRQFARHRAAADRGPHLRHRLFPDRKPVYTAPYMLYVLNAEQHAIWITEQLASWHRQSLEVRDRELQLYETNKRLRELPAAELDRPETRRQIERQADAERVNGRRLANLTESGKDLLRQAARNPEIGVGHLDKWAEMLQILADISANRMPSVADLLKRRLASAAVGRGHPARRQPPGRWPSAGVGRQTGQRTGTAKETGRRHPPCRRSSTRNRRSNRKDHSLVRRRKTASRPRPNCVCP